MDPLEIQSDAPKHASPIRGRVSKGIKILTFFLAALVIVSKFLSESTIVYLKLLLVFLAVPVGFIVFGVIGLNSNCANNALYLPIWLIVNGILVLLVFFVGLAKEPLVSLHN